jgi:hypothetical protein
MEMLKVGASYQVHCNDTRVSSEFGVCKHHTQSLIEMAARTQDYACSNSCFDGRCERSGFPIQQASEHNIRSYIQKRVRVFIRTVRI